MWFYCAHFQNGGQITCVLHHVVLLCTFSKWRPYHVCSPSCGSIVHIFKMEARSLVFSIMWFYCAHFQSGGYITFLLEFTLHLGVETKMQFSICAKMQKSGKQIFAKFHDILFCETVNRKKFVSDSTCIMQGKCGVIFSTTLHFGRIKRTVVYR
jgi:hypothetical protein